MTSNLVLCQQRYNNTSVRIVDILWFDFGFEPWNFALYGYTTIGMLFQIQGFSEIFRRRGLSVRRRSIKEQCDQFLNILWGDEYGEVALSSDNCEERKNRYILDVGSTTFLDLATIFSLLWVTSQSSNNTWPTCHIYSISEFVKIDETIWTVRDNWTTFLLKLPGISNTNFIHDKSIACWSVRKEPSGFVRTLS